MKQSIPQISVLMSVFNGERWLAESIESIINQSYKNFEFIIINDGSKDKSYKIIERYAIQDKRIIKVNNESNEVVNEILFGAMRSPTMQVNKTKDITLGFIKLKKDCKLKIVLCFMLFDFVKI